MPDHYLDILFFLSVSIVGNALFSVCIFLITNIGAKKKTYFKAETNDTYVVYKWFRGRGKGCHIAYKFKKDGDKWIFLKEKITFSSLLPYIIILGLFFIIAVIKAGLSAGIGVLLYAILIFAELTFALYVQNVLYCKRFLLDNLM